MAAVNCGGDTDTVGAIAGEVAGAGFGAFALPGRWLAAIGPKNPRAKPYITPDRHVTGMLPTR